jgi:hypothetical protein
MIDVEAIALADDAFLFHMPTCRVAVSSVSDLFRFALVVGVLFLIVTWHDVVLTKDGLLSHSHAI